MVPYKQPSLVMTAGVQEHTLVALEGQTPTARITTLAVANDSTRLRSNSLGLPQKTHSCRQSSPRVCVQAPASHSTGKRPPMSSMPFCTPIMTKNPHLRLLGLLLYLSTRPNSLHRPFHLSHPHCPRHTCLHRSPAGPFLYPQPHTEQPSTQSNPIQPALNSRRNMTMHTR